MSINNNSKEKKFQVFIRDLSAVVGATSNFIFFRAQHFVHIQFLSIHPLLAWMKLAAAMVEAREENKCEM